MLSPQILPGSHAEVSALSMQTPRSTVWAVIPGAHRLIHEDARLASVGAHLRATIVAAIALVSSALKDGLRCVRAKCMRTP
jgi:hypothetical protein